MSHPDTLSVLLVEDSPSDALLVREMLSELPGGCRVEHAQTLTEALKWLAGARPSCVILDLSLPDADGLDGVRRLSEAHPALPVVVLTGQVSDELGLEAVQAGAEDYICKQDCDPALLERTVRYAVERRAIEAERRSAVARFESMFEHSPLGTAVLSLDGRIEQANPAFAAILGRATTDLESVRLRELVHPADMIKASETLRSLVAGEVTQLQSELCFLHRGSTPVDVAVHGTLMYDATGHPESLLCQFQDISERKRFEERLQFMADHDPLTGLLNRRKFEAELERHVAQVRRYGPAGAVVVLDIDHFKQVNDTLGHNAGDELIVSIAGVLRARLRESDVLARLGGDEFAVLLPRVNEAEAEIVAKALVESVRHSTTLLNGEPHQVTTSVGVAVFDDDLEELTGEGILINADLAMYDAKGAGRDGWARFERTTEAPERTETPLTWITRIRHALAHDRFVLFAQPILDLATGEVRQHELLIRMLDDQGEIIPPGAFLAIAERFGLIAQIDEWVAHQAIAMLEQHPDLQLEINISGYSLSNQRLLQALEERVRTSTADPHRLIFEVTETAAVANVTHARAFAERLRELGCRFALDDFGAGFGSFYYLKHLPFDYIKIDGEFVRHAATGRVDQLVIEAVVKLAGGLGKATIAEFVADADTQRMVEQLGVDFGQGFHIAKPFPAQILLDTPPLMSDASASPEPVSAITAARERPGRVVQS